MKTNHLRFAIVSLVFVLVLSFAGGCSCNAINGNVPQEIPTPDYAVPSEVSSTDTSDISESDISSSDISDSDISESVSVSVTDTEIAETTTVSSTDATTSTTNKTTVSTSSSNSKNAPGVHKPNYKTKYYIVVHTGSQSVAIYGKNADGYYTELIKCFTCSTGTKGHETRTGAYTIWRKFRWRALVGGVYGQYNSSISRDYLFHSVPYLKQSVDRLDTEEYDKLGSPASHGCIRLCVRDAKWIYDNCAIDTQVYITNTSGPAGQGVPPRNTDSAYDGWDPSDKWAKHNPYFYSPSTASTTTTTAATTASTASSAPSAETETTTASAVTTTTTAAETTTATTTTTTATTTATTTTTAAPPSEDAGE